MTDTTLEDPTWSARDGHRLEVSQVVWRHAFRVTRDPATDDGTATLLELLRIARHDRSTLRHALGLGRTLVSGATDLDPRHARAVRMLERAIAWSGGLPSERRR